MSNEISSEYRELTGEELNIFGADYDRAWLDPTMPERQYRRVVAGELEIWRRGGDVLPYRIALEAMQSLGLENPTLLDVGAATGYYSEVLNSRGCRCQYTGIDFSEDFKRIAVQLFPSIRFDVGDARKLPYRNGEFEVVLHGACIMHVREYEQAIREAARVASRFVIFHRTPILVDGPTRHYAKEAYGVPCMESWFNESELIDAFSLFGLILRQAIEVFWSEEDKRGHRTYILEKELPEPYASNPHV